MPRFSMLQTNFTAGEISPKLMGRVDIARYANGVEQLTNAFPLVFGGARRRMGTQFMAETKTSAKRSVLIPFVFNKDTAYMLEFGDQTMRVFTKDGQVLSGASPFEIATPYTEAMLAALRNGFTQGLDTMFLFHEDQYPRRLRRFASDSWDVSNVPFVVLPFDEIGFKPGAGLTLSAATVGTGRTFTADAAVFLASDVGRTISSAAGLATITAFTDTTHVTCTIDVAFSGTSIASGAWNLDGSPQTTCTPSAKDPVGKAITLTLGANGWRSSDVGKYVVINGGLCKITGYTSATIVDATIETVMTSNVASESGAWSLEGSAWSSANGYPRTGTLHEQRLFVGGTPTYKQTVYGSRTGLYLDFTKGTNDDDGFAFKLASTQLDSIANIVPMKALAILTHGSEMTMHGGVEKPIGPTNVQVKNHTVHGCADVRPVRVGLETIFAQRSRKRIRAMSYQFENDSYAAPDLSLLAEHITGRGIVDMDFQLEPFSILWMVLDTGELASMTFDRAQDVIGFATHATDGLVESVACMPGSDGDDVWLVVNRTIDGSTKRYVEKMVDGINTDCCITGTSGPGAATWTGLDHLEGKEVHILADGVVMPPQTVTGGEITLPRTANSVEIGLPYTAVIGLLPIEAQIGGTAQGKNVRLGEVTVRLLETMGCKINGDQIPFRKFGLGILDSAVEPFTGDKTIELLGWEKSGGRVTITQDQPLPLHVLAVVRRVTIND